MANIRLRAPGLLFLLIAATVSAQQSSPPATLASTVDRQITNVEKLVVDAAEAMPEDKYDFSPASLKIPGAAYDRVRSFALQVKHIAASNYILWASLTGETFPKDFLGGNGPEALKTKAEIVKFLKDSYALGHRAAATLTPESMPQPAGSSTRIARATFCVAPRSMAFFFSRPWRSSFLLATRQPPA